MGRWTLCAALALSMATVTACGKDSDAEAAGARAASAKASSGPSDKAIALKKAWEGDSNCQILDKCCSNIAGTKWESTLTAFCKTLDKKKDFESRASGGADASWVTRDCAQTVKGLQSMGNASNPLPDACLGK